MHGVDYLGMASYVSHFLWCPISTKCFATIPMGTQQRRGKDYSGSSLQYVEGKMDMANIEECTNSKDVHVCVRFATSSMSCY